MVGRRTAAWFDDDRGCRGTGARISGSARRPDVWRVGGSKAPVMPLGVLTMRGTSSTGDGGGRRG
jgi:hypothetical protein